MVGAVRGWDGDLKPKGAAADEDESVDEAESVVDEAKAKVKLLVGGEGVGKEAF